jgi:hypothetical protein
MQDPKTIDLYDAGFSQRVQTCLKNNFPFDFKLADFALLDDTELLDCRNFGVKSLANFKEVLVGHGFVFNGYRYVWQPPTDLA